MKRSSTQIFKTVVEALVLREIQARFGSQKLGYLWAIVDPMVMILVFAFMHSLIESDSHKGYDYAVFLATGFLPFNYFRSIVLNSLGAFNANKALFVYKQVKPFDTFVSRFIVESTINLVVMIIFIFIGWYFGFDMRVKDIAMVVVGIIWIALFAFSLGIFLGVLGYFYENFAKVVRIVMMPLMFVSGLFFSLDSLPQIAREILIYNPVLHFIEMIHGYYFFPLDDRYVDYRYMLLWTVVPGFLGLWLYKRSERKIIMS